MHTLPPSWLVAYAFELGESNPTGAYILGMNNTTKNPVIKVYSKTCWKLSYSRDVTVLWFYTSEGQTPLRLWKSYLLCLMRNFTSSGERLLVQAKKFLPEVSEVYSITDAVFNIIYLRQLLQFYFHTFSIKNLCANKSWAFVITFSRCPESVVYVTNMVYRTRSSLPHFFRASLQLAAFLITVVTRNNVRTDKQNQQFLMSGLPEIIKNQFKFVNITKIKVKTLHLTFYRKLPKCIFFFFYLLKVMENISNVFHFFQWVIYETIYMDYFIYY